jgi:hypothetical protein
LSLVLRGRAGCRGGRARRRCGPIGHLLDTARPGLMPSRLEAPPDVLQVASRTRAGSAGRIASTLAESALDAEARVLAWLEAMWRADVGPARTWPMATATMIPATAAPAAAQAASLTKRTGRGGISAGSPLKYPRLADRSCHPPTRADASDCGAPGLPSCTSDSRVAGFRREDNSTTLSSSELLGSSGLDVVPSLAFRTQVR